MDCVLFYSCQSLSGWNGDSVLPHLPILHSQSKSITWLSNLRRPERVAEVVRTTYPLNIERHLCIAPTVFAKVKRGSYKDWMAIYRRLDPRPLRRFQSLFIMGGLLSSGSQLGRHLHRVGVFPHDRGQMLFQSQALNLINVLLILKAHNEFRIPLHEWAFDPLELSVDQFHADVAPQTGYQLYHGYRIPAYGARRLDSLQYYYRRQREMTSDEKSLDFVFGYTMLKGSGRQKHRQDVEEFARRFAKGRRKLFIRHDERGLNTLVSKSEYLKLLSKARFTLILPAYDKAQFSIYRLLEALRVDCLPVLHPDVDAQKLNAVSGWTWRSYASAPRASEGVVNWFQS